MILNRQRTVRVARRPLELFLRRLREHLGLGTADVAICLVSDAEIARMNETFRKKKGPTDVLSFPAIARRKPVRPSRAPRRGTGASFRPHAVAPASSRHPRQGTALAVPQRGAGSRALAPEVAVPARRTRSMGNPHYLGDIAISPATARRNAKQYGRTLQGELRILILHGTLHLLGYDHETDRGEMYRFEQRLRRRLGLS
jgi:rRNA maturation RNase YbeY